MRSLALLFGCLAIPDRFPEAVIQDLQSLPSEGGAASSRIGAVLHRFSGVAELEQLGLGEPSDDLVETRLVERQGSAGETMRRERLPGCYGVSKFTRGDKLNFR